MQEALIQSLVTATALEEATIRKLLTKPPQREHGDLAFPCFPLAKTWKLSPPECAAKLVAELELPESIDAATPTGPYVNFKYNRALLLEKTIPPILRAGANVGQQPTNGERVVIEYSAPNIAKTFHVGHLRTTLIGHALVQIYKHCGYEVVGINHLGDWGTQFGFVWAGCELWGKPAEVTVEGLVEIYKRATGLRKAQDDDTVAPEDADLPNINQMAKDYFLRLEDGDPEATAFWQWCLDLSLDYLKLLYTRLGIEFDHYTGESFYRNMLPDVEQKIRASGILEDSRGALGVDCGKKLGFARIFTEDGRSLYITRDIATAMYRTETFKPLKILYVVGAQQNLHFNQLVEILRLMPHPAADKVHHIPFGFVPGMKTREGGGISLKEFLDEATSRALDVYRTEVSRKPEGLDEDGIAEAVAIGSTYFYFLSHSNIKDFQFSWKEALNFQGDSGPYLQYAVARINSIQANAKQAGLEIDEAFTTSVLTEDSAHDLTLSLSEFSAVVEKACTECEPYYIANYLVDVAKGFSRAYRELQVMNESDTQKAIARLSLFVAVKHVLATGLRLIGVPLVDRM
ncbi:arginine--tRNA ligase [Oligoflexia bacterium]|nr:arginine--tRNA ligase [Oligoflexia bacterium]